MYCGSIIITNLQSREVLNLLLSSNELGFQLLLGYIQENLIEYHYNFINENSVEIIELIYQKKSLDGVFVFNKFVIILMTYLNQLNFFQLIHLF